MRVEASVSGTPSPYASRSLHGDQEASHGVAVTLDVATADSSATATGITVFATHPGWEAWTTGGA